MPAEQLIRVLEEGLSAAGVGSTEVVSKDLGELSREATTAVVDEMVAGSEFPMVLVGKRVVCVGGVDLEAVLKALMQD